MDPRTLPRRTNNSPIAQARRARGWTQAQLAEAIGKTSSQIANWELGIRRPKLDALNAIAEALEIDLKDLIQK